MMMELGQRFMTRTDERLLAVIHTLQQVGAGGRAGRGVSRRHGVKGSRAGG